MSPILAAYLPPVLLLQQVPHLVGVVSIPLAFYAWRLRSRATAFALVFLTVLLAAPLLRGLRSEISSPPSGGPTGLRVVTWNVANDLVDRTQLQAFLETCDADIVALQELSPGKAAWLEGSALDVFPHRTLHGLGKGGLPLLSRSPLLESHLGYLRGEWPYLRARVEGPDDYLTVLVTHPRAWLSVLGAWQPAYEDFETLAEMASQNSPSLILGDFNTTERSAVYQRILQHGLVDAYRTHTQASGFTFPVSRRFRHLPCPPIARIDYIFHSKDLATTQCWVGKDAGSDHLPLFADLRLSD